MKLTLLDIEDFIKKNNIKPVSSVKKYEKPGKTDINGLFSEEIFGRFGSKERRTTFGYIDLNCTVIHPEAYTIFTGLNPILSKCIYGKDYFTIVDGNIVITTNSENTFKGIHDLIKNFDKIDLDKLGNKKPNNLKFIKNNKDQIFINKFLVLPAGIRDMQISRTSGETIIQYSDVVNLYENLINQTRLLTLGIENVPADFANTLVQDIQRKVIEINDWIKGRIKGKYGLIRGGLLKKVTDYSARLVVSSDPSLNLGEVGIPWQVVLKIFEPFTLHQILYKDKSHIDLIKNELNIDKNLEINDVKRFLTRLIDNPTNITPLLKEYFISVAIEITKDKFVIYKRDPVENRDSWLCANVRVEEKGFNLKLNPLDLPRTGGDCDGDAYPVFSLLTKEANEEAKNKMHPVYSKGMWTQVTNNSKCPYEITLDASTAIFAATKE